MRTHFCTIVARNYLPQALALHASVREHSPEAGLTVLLLDGNPPEEAPSWSQPGPNIVGPTQLFSRIRDFYDLAAIYDVVELATAVKPLLLMHLLKQHEAVTYLDPDTFLVSPLFELADVLEEHPVVLTPHFLGPIPPDSAIISEIHCLTVGVFNLGFIAVNRDATSFLSWWWSHLENECLNYPLLGLFVDQKWVDVGASYFHVHSLRHAGYNVGPWNLHERTLRQDPHSGVLVGDVELRLFHFSGFDLDAPEELSSRLSQSTARLLDEDPVLRALSRQYAALLSSTTKLVGIGEPYAFARDANGKAMTLRVRRAYRAHRLQAGGETLPSPFIKSESTAFRRWRRKSRTMRAKQLMADAAIAGKYVFPEESHKIRRLMPAQSLRWRARLLAAGRVRR